MNKNDKEEIMKKILKIFLLNASKND
jgi:hypothetical protein